MVSQRLRVCIEAGSAVALFPVLKDWSQDELRLLLEDVEAFHELVEHDIERVWQEQLFRPEVFFHNSAAHLVNEARDEAKLELLAMCSEIASVALFYLKERYGEEFKEDSSD